MSLVIEQGQPVPLTSGTDGVIRVAGTRVTLDKAAYAFERDGIAEEIVQQHPAFPMADVYSVLGYLLRHQPEVAAYLTARGEQRAAGRREIEGRIGPAGLRARLLARRPHPTSQTL